MKTKYTNPEIETFLKKIWNLANTYQENKRSKKEARLRQFYFKVLRQYKEKQQVNSTNYIFKF